MSITNIKYVVGIDFGAKSSGISVAHVNKPSVKYTVDTWEGDGKTSNKEPSQFLTSILYQADGEIKCGLSNNENDRAIRDEKDIYIDNIKQYLLDIEQANVELGEMREGLTIQQVVCDYLRLFIKLGLERIKLQEDFKQSEDFKHENIRYCISCPKSQEEFIKNCLIEAKIVQEEDGRLVFVTEAEATAYHCISLDRQKTKIIHDHTYLVCDIGHSSFGISKILADTTENLSNVELIYEEPGQGSMNLEVRLRDYLTENQDRLKLNSTIIDKLVETFVDDIKFSFGMAQVEDTFEENQTEVNEEGIETDDDEEEDEDYDEDEDEDEDDDDEEIVFVRHEIVDKQVEDLEVGDEQEETDVPVFSELDKDGNPISISPQELDEHVFSPYIDSVFNYILKADENVEGINGESRIFLSGRYSSNDHFLEKLMASKDSQFARFFCPIEDDYINAVSLGATSFGLKSDKKSQTPFYVNTEPSDKNGPKKYGSSGSLEQKKVDFIVGIDFGTTYSGCSYADCRDIDDPSQAEIKTIETGWPGGNAISFGKTPTLIMYDKKMKPKYWGQEAKIKVDHNKDLTLLGNFKLFLSPKSVARYYGPNNEEIAKIRAENDYGVRVEDSSQEKKGPYKVKKYKKEESIDAVKIIADYLRVFKDRVIKYIISTETRKSKVDIFSDLFRKEENGGFNFKFVITVPDMWTTSAKETMAQAAIEATIIKKDELDKLLIISEPEAAALFCEKKYQDLVRDPEDPTAGSKFIVCDAGGGTVDLVTFSLEFNKQGEPMICQIGDGSGDTCGSTYLDGKFKDYLEEFYKDMKVDITFSNTNFDSVMENFVHNLKINYVSRANEDSYLDIRLPTNRIIHEVPAEAIGKYYLYNNNTVLRMRNVDMKEKVFDPIVDRILKLIQGQLDQAIKAGETIKTILMIGGFSRNKYLQQRVKDEYNGICTVGIPEEGIAAVSNGAVSYGLEPRMISERLAGHSLALEVRAPFDKTKEDAREKIVYDINHKEYTKNRLEYFVKKSQVIHGENREVYHKTVSVEYPNSAVIAVFSYDFKEEDNPKDWRYVSKKHTKIMEETIELPKLETIRVGEKIFFDVGLKMDHIGVTVTIKCKDARINAFIKEDTDGRKSSLTINRKCSLVVFRNKSPLIEYSLAQSNFLLGSS